ncbi:DUF1801 domain-containing protein [uncultured Parvibaculum sp.]|uniref:DUF1801 domain-containing protein n=2 Tax=Parvibaculum TaxID=256616 RepID=UPI0030DA9A51
MIRATTLPAMSAEVAAVFDDYPAFVRERLLQVRRLIFRTAAETDGVGPLTETLKWGEPAYLTEASGSGTTIRLGVPRAMEGRCAVFVNCRTTLVDTFRSQFPEAFEYQGNRAILLNVSGPLPKEPLAICLSMALTYHRRPASAAPRPAVRRKPA